MRELENVLTRAVVLSKGPVLLPDCLPDLFDCRPKHPDSEQLKSLSRMERDHIARALAQTGWKLGQACEILGITRPTSERKSKNTTWIPDAEGLGKIVRTFPCAIERGFQSAPSDRLPFLK